MTLDMLRSLMTVVGLAVFLAIVVWAWSSRNRARFDEAARLPFTDDSN